MVIEFCPMYSIGFLTSSESVLFCKCMSFMFSILQKFWAHSSLYIWSSNRFSGQLQKLSGKRCLCRSEKGCTCLPVSLQLCSNKRPRFSLMLVSLPCVFYPWTRQGHKLTYMYHNPATFILTSERLQAAGVAVFWPTPGFKGKTFTALCSQQRDLNFCICITATSGVLSRDVSCLSF